MTKKIEKLKDINYDDLPYDNKPDLRTHISAIAGVAKVFELKTVAVSEARVLEIGCAWGANLIPMAESFPKSEFVGVDLSKKQVEMAEATLKNMPKKLKNIKIKNKSFTDLTAKKDGKFDYIIAHGIYSWISKEKQDALIKKCAELLSDKGVIHISYNTLPGWNMVKTVRDLLKFHTKDTETFKGKGEDIGRILEFVSQNTSGDSSYGKFFADEWEQIKDKKLSYILHDYLEVENNPCYFSEFMSKAESNGLSYLGDISLPSMFLGNFSETVKNSLSEVKDIVKQEQYMDYLSNRRFRGTLLFKNSKKRVAHRNIKFESIKDMYFVTKSCFVEHAKPMDFKKGKEFEFASISNSEMTFKVKSGLAAAVLASIVSNALSPANKEKIIESALLLLKPSKAKQKETKENLEKIVSEVLLIWVMKGIIDLHSFDFPCAKEISSKPKISGISMAQIKLGVNYTTTCLHRTIELKPIEKIILSFCDGKNTVEDINNEIFKLVKSKALSIESDDEVKTEKQQKEKVANFVKGTLSMAIMNRLLIS